MTARHTLLDSLPYSIVRISPALSALFFISLPQDLVQASLMINRLLILTVTILAWNLIEGTFMVYLQKRQRDPSAARGYLIVLGLFAVCILALFTLFRSYGSQALFLLLLATLSLRGMSRVGWDQGRLRVAMATCLAGHTLLSLLSILCTLDSFRWQEPLVALAVGASATAVELAWHSEALSPPATARYAAPLFRLTLVAGPIIVATLAFVGQLSIEYSAVYGALILALPVLRNLLRQGLALPRTARTSTGVYLLFVAIMLGCRLYLSGRLS